MSVSSDSRQTERMMEVRTLCHARHSGVAMRLAARMSSYAETHRLGAVYGQDAAYLVNGQLLVPDISFISAAKISSEGEPAGPWPMAPDLAVEVITAADSGESIQQRMTEYFAAGARQVWIVLLESRNINVYRSATDFVVVTEEDVLFNIEIIPGFRCHVAELFRQPGQN